MRNPRSLLTYVRRYTGDHFTSKNGYDARKPLNFGQRMAILKYAEKIDELLSKPVTEYRPKRGEKTEAFEYTGQKGFRFFDVALVHTPDTSAEFEFKLDKSRPKGSRFVPTNKKTGQRYYHIPAKVFLDPDNLPDDFNEWLTEQGIWVDDLSEDELNAYIIQFYAEDAEFYLIQAGESYMWGAGGGADAVAAKVSLILNNYGPSMFAANDRKSSYYGNWFRGVTGFTNRFDIVPSIGEAQRRRRERAAKYKISVDRKWRQLKDGSFGLFENGRMIERMWPNGQRD